MLRLFFRFLATAMLAIAVVFGVVDSARSIAEDRLVVTPLADSLATGWPAGLASLRALVESVGIPALWEPGMSSILMLPGAVVFAVLALLAYLVGHRRRTLPDLRAREI